MEGLDLWRKAKSFSMSVGVNIYRIFKPSPFDVKQGERKEIMYRGEKATLKLNPKNLRIVGFPDKEEVIVVDKYGGEIGYSTKNIQKLVSRELSPSAGIYAGMAEVTPSQYKAGLSEEMRKEIMKLLELLEEVPRILEEALGEAEETDVSSILGHDLVNAGEDMVTVLHCGHTWDVWRKTAYIKWSYNGHGKIKKVHEEDINGKKSAIYEVNVYFLEKFKQRRWEYTCSLPKEHRGRHHGGGKPTYDYRYVDDFDSRVLVRKYKKTGVEPVEISEDEIKKWAKEKAKTLYETGEIE